MSSMDCCGSLHCNEQHWSLFHQKVCFSGSNSNKRHMFLNRMLGFYILFSPPKGGWLKQDAPIYINIWAGLISSRPVVRWIIFSFIKAQLPAVDSSSLFPSSPIFHAPKMSSAIRKQFANHIFAGFWSCWGPINTLLL